MEQAICLMSVAPLRFADDDRSEMVSQLLFGDRMEILEKKEKWYLVKVADDGYQGWVSAGQVTMLSQEQSQQLDQAQRSVSTDPVQLLEDRTNNTSFPVSAGSTFYNCNDNAFEIAGSSFYFHGSIIPLGKARPELLTSHAMLFLNSPYMWGGKSALGIDCSGLTQLVYKMSGIPILRDASLQAGQGQMLSLIYEAQPGDLLFFDNDEQQITHVGILLDDDHIIHAHHQVRIDKVDHQGIFNTQLRKYTHKLRFIKRLVPAE